GVDLGGVRWGQATVLEPVPDDFEPLLQAGTMPLLLRGVRRGGAVFLLLADLESGNLARHPAFPVLVANLVPGATRDGPPPPPNTGAPLPLPAAAAFPQVRLALPGGETVLFNEQRPVAFMQTLEPGLYQMELTSASGA